MLGTQYTYFTTIQHSNAGIATVLQYFGPTLILLYVCFKEKRKPKPYEVVVLFLSLLGVFILATHGDMNTLKVSSVALFWGMLSAITLVIYTVQPAEILKKYGTAVVIAWGMFIGGIALSITAKPWEQPVKVDIVVIVFGKYFCVSVLSVRCRNYRTYEGKYDSLYRTCGSYDMLCSVFRESFFLFGCDRICVYIIHSVYCSIHFG